MWIHVLPKGNKRPIHSSLLESQKKLTKQDQNCRVDIEEQVMMLSSLIVIKWNKKSLNAYEPKAKLSGRVNHPPRVPFLEVDPGCPLSLLLDTGSFLQGQQTWSWVQPWSLVGVEGKRIENRILGHIDSIYIAQDISASTGSNQFGPTDLLKNNLFI
uniref:Uncharacterized protein n=1 Tax=Pipistrellus kuhlii TaxID=59472 RepID=A0A7J7WDQ5_PIPKU|nr:hypothetical protein mPipKuh1_008031 [Pipistrellus kuhlii]